MFQRKKGRQTCEKLLTSALLVTLSINLFLPPAEGFLKIGRKRHVQEKADRDQMLSGLMKLREQAVKDLLQKVSDLRDIDDMLSFREWNEIGDQEQSLCDVKNGGKCDKKK
ncbi:uncharacterized protein [Clytia hemisphaerica]|uniref:Uncharacterized protein n=1 Tax=Clytia hemisphaerica TaxID=252671 RepID=A0A7M5UMF0_9CNID